jgi:hypothetical protein
MLNISMSAHENHVHGFSMIPCLCSMWVVGHLPLVYSSYWIRSIIKETHKVFAMLIMQAFFCKVLNLEHLNSPLHFFLMSCEIQFSFHPRKFPTIKKSILQSMAFERMST